MIKINKKLMNQVLSFILCLFLASSVLAGYFFARQDYLTKSKKYYYKKTLRNLSLNIKSDRTIPYGSVFKAEDWFNGIQVDVRVDSTVDTKKLGEQKVVFHLSAEDEKYHQKVNKDMEISFQVVDSEAATISLKKDKVELKVGDSFDPKENVEKVEDVVDGALVYSEELNPGTFSVMSQVRPHRIGEYTVKVIAKDINGNQSEKTYSVLVKKDIEEKEEKKEELVSDKKEKQTLSVNPSSPTEETTATQETKTETTTTPSAGGGSTTATTSTATLTAAQQKIAKNAAANVAAYHTEGNYLAIKNYLMSSLGLNKAAASGILSNFYFESKFIPDIGTTYYGIAQWGGSRKINLLNYAQSQGLSEKMLQTQLGFLAQELTGPYARVYSALKAIPNTADGAARAATIFVQRFEGVSVTSGRKELAVVYFYQ